MCFADTAFRLPGEVVAVRWASSGAVQAADGGAAVTGAGVGFEADGVVWVN